ncbi:MAG: hypothetical protein WCY43_01635 [Patescibacteria group bacterium]|nr:hypothetical protein [Patescibacteria group bacterium]
MNNEKIARSDFDKDFKERVLFQKTIIELRKEVNFLLSIINKKERRENLNSSISFIKNKSQDIIALLRERIKEHPENQELNHFNNKKNDLKHDDNLFKIKNCLIENIDFVLQSSINGKRGFDYSQETIKRLEKIIEAINILNSLYENKINK